MKKICTIILAMILCLSATNFALETTNAAYSPANIYARVLKPDVIVYSKPDISPQNAVFTLTETYYITITNANYSGDFYPISMYEGDISYAPITGFVLKSEVSIWETAPTVPPYPTIKATTKYLSIMSSQPAPINKDNIGNSMVVMANSNMELYTYGKIYNEVTKTNYYLVLYGNLETNKISVGYLDEASLNIEEPLVHPDPLPLPPVITPDPLDPVDNPTDNNTPKDTNNDNLYQVILIAAICIPALFVVYLMFRPAKRNRKAYKKYYDYDEVE